MTSRLHSAASSAVTEPGSIDPPPTEEDDPHVAATARSPSPPLETAPAAANASPSANTIASAVSPSSSLMKCLSDLFSCQKRPYFLDFPARPGVGPSVPAG